MHASAAESLLPFLSHPGARVLDIGSGSGYLTFVLAHLVGENGRAVGVEHIGALMELGRRNVGKSEEGERWLREGRVRFVVGDGRMGWSGEEKGEGGSGGAATAGAGAGAGDTTAGATATAGQEKSTGAGDGMWDAIHVGAAAKEVHEPLIRQLKAPGRLFIPVEEADSRGQWIWVIDKAADGKVTRRRDIGVRYVPLCDAPKG